MSVSLSSKFRALADTVMVAAILAGINWLTARPDPGWILLNPSPWLLLPLLIGARYGLWAGTLSGAAAAFGVMLCQQAIVGEQVALKTVSQANPFYYTGLCLVGLLSGTFHLLVTTQVQSAQDKSTRSTQARDMLKAELDVVREGRAQLQKQLLTYRCSFTSLDDDLRKLFAGPEEDLPAGVLAVLHKHCGLVSGGLYHHEGGGVMQRVGVLHETPELPEELHTNFIPMAAQALSEQVLISVATPVKLVAEQPYLAAIPWMWQGKDGLLLIQDMPLRNFDWECLSQMELALKWAFSLDTLRKLRRNAGDPSAFVALEDFLFLLNESLEAEHTHQLPSVICRADFLDAKEAADVSLIRRILRALPLTAVPTRLPSNGSIIALLPFCGEMEGASLGRELAALGAKLRTTSFSVMRPTDGPADVSDFWALVTKD